jgi:predicted RNA-binding protein with RPS1 domain
MSWTKKVKNPRSILEIGQDLEVVVCEVDSEKRRLSLSLRATEPNPWEQVAETYNVGSTVKGVVRNLTDFGAFVEIIPGVDGLVHISDMSWTRRINHPSEVVQKGDEVEAVITSVDSYNQRISLSMKELLPNEWEEYANKHSVGDVVGGVVTNITDFGVFVELAPGVEGLCHISEIDRDEGLSLAEMFNQSQAVNCRILRVDWHESRIGLSMHGVDQDETIEESSEGAAASAPTETAMAAALRAGGLVEETSSKEEASDEAPEAEAEAAPATDGGGDEAEAAAEGNTAGSADDETAESSDDETAESSDDEKEAEAAEVVPAAEETDSTVEDAEPQADAAVGEEAPEETTTDSDGDAEDAATEEAGPEEETADAGDGGEAEEDDKG